MKQQASITKLLMLAVSVLVLAYFGLQAARYFRNPLTTTLAYVYQVEEKTELDGYVARQEQVLPAVSGGQVQILRHEGERVSAGGAIAAIYADASAVERQAELEKLDSRIAQLEYAREAILGVEASLKLDSQIVQNLVNYRADIAAGRLDAAEEHGSDLRALVLKRDFIYSDSQDPAAQLEALKKERRQLEKEAVGSVRKVTVSRSGLFSSVVDGYETVLTPEVLAELPPSQLEALEPQTAEGVGKLVLGDQWYYTAVLPAQEAKALLKEEAALQQKGGSLQLRFSKHVEQDLEVEITSVGPEEKGNCTVTFQGDAYLQQLTLLRRQSAEVIRSSITGIRIPKEALRVLEQTQTAEDGTEKTVRTSGVYCVIGAEACFKPVEVLYSGGEFVLVRSVYETADEELTSAQEKRKLRTGDEVIVIARELYDGKVVSG